MDFKKLALIYVLVFFWFAVYYLAFGCQDIPACGLRTNQYIYQLADYHYVQPMPTNRHTVNRGSLGLSDGVSGGFSNGGSAAFGVLPILYLIGKVLFFVIGAIVIGQNGQSLSGGQLSHG